MPELPEVETIVRQLQKKIRGRKITKIEIYDTAVVGPKLKNIPPAKITNVWRRAKYIIMELDDRHFIITHLGMTGHFHFVENSAGKKRVSRGYEKYIVSKFLFSDGSFLTHNSIRKFGKMRLVDWEQLQKILSKLGAEPLDEKFTLQHFHGLLRKRSRANIKAVLMDQQAIAGVGNIYAQEALYHAGVSPLRKAGSLSAGERKSLYTELRRILLEAIRYHGTTVDNYSNLEGSGGFQDHLAVYQKERCAKNHPLKKIIVGGRGTTYCPKCQR